MVRVFFGRWCWYMVGVTVACLCQAWGAEFWGKFLAGSVVGTLAMLLPEWRGEDGDVR